MSEPDGGTEPSRSSPYRSRPDQAIDDAERARLGERLNAAFESGAVDEDGYRARLDRLYAARTLGELLPVVEGLPPLPTHATPAIVAAAGGAGAPGELTPARGGRGLGVGVALAVGGSVLLLVLIVVLLLA